MDKQLTASQEYGVVYQDDFVRLEGRRVVEVIKGADSLKHVEPNDFVISMRSFQGGIEWCKLKGSISWHYVMLVPIKNVHPPFFAHLLKSLTYIQALRATTDLIRDGQELRYSHFVQVDVPLVPMDEQIAIASFLDRETAKIDALVAEQERLIELLKEKRQAVISHAVTKGLNPNAPMKPSGVEWLGEIPAHWELAPLRYSITGIDQGWSPQCLSDPAPEGEWGVLKVGCGNGDNFDPSEQKALPSDVAPPQQYEIKAGDILMSRGNTLELVGMATLVPEVRRLLLSDLLYRFRVQPERMEPEFLVLFLRSSSARFQIERNATGTSPSMKKIGQETIRSLIIPRPSLAEQRVIIAYIREQTTKLDALTSEAKRATKLLQERRTALISAAVTGQIDVRAAAGRSAA